MDHRIFLKTDLSVYHINGIQFLIRIAAYPVFSDYVFVCFVILVVRDMPDDLVLKFLLIAQTKFEQVAFRFDKVIDIHGGTRVKIIVIFDAGYNLPSYAGSVMLYKGAQE